MKVKLLNGKKKLSFNIPESFDELNLGRYQRLMAVLKKDEDVHDIEKVIRILNCITDIPKRQLYGLDMKSIGKLGKHLTTFLETVPTDELKHFIEIEGVEYGFHPQLSEITMGEWVDIDTYIGQGVEENLHKIMSVLYRPIVEKDGDLYCIEEYKPCQKRQELFKNKLKVGDFYGVSVFFSDLGRELLTNTLNSSIVELKSKMKDIAHSETV